MLLQSERVASSYYQKDTTTQFWTQFGWGAGVDVPGRWLLQTAAAHVALWLAPGSWLHYYFYISLCCTTI